MPPGAAGGVAVLLSPAGGAVAPDWSGVVGGVSDLGMAGFLSAESVDRVGVEVSAGVGSSGGRTNDELGG